MDRHRRLILLLAALWLPSGAQPEVEIEARAVLERRCLNCHGPQTRMAGLDLSRRETALAGGSRGTALQPGAPDDSLLLARVLKNEMPPAAPLPGAEKEVLRRWIAAGAPWGEAIEVRRAGPDWWALQPLKTLEPPAGAPETWARSPIDRWVYTKLAAEGLRPSPVADRRALIRRLYFDLTGLPPSPEEIASFVHDRDPETWERLVDRLLASPHYGERWARHWLDVVRYAESEGFERDWLRDHAWSYRDYVIRSFNQDKSYQQFAREQIAGDLLEPVTHDSIRATGLLVLGPWDAVGLTSAVEQERTAVREDQLEELLGVVGQTFLGLTVNCARCHDHKFDPIPQKDYYRLKAVFEGVWQPTVGEDLRADGRPLLTPAEAAEREARLAPIRQRIADREEALGNLYRKARAKALGHREGAAGKKPAPRPVARWTFDTDFRDDFGALHATPREETQPREGRLAPAEGKDSLTVSTRPFPFDLREKTLEAWIRVRCLPEKPATILRIRNRSGFRGAAVDGIQYAAGDKKQWENLSTVRFRSEDVDGPPEEAATGDRIQMAIVYAADHSIRLYRNGQPYGRAYTPEIELAAGRLQTYLKDDAIVELTGTKDLELEEARIYNTALEPEQIAASYSAGIANFTPEQLTQAMTAEERKTVAKLRAGLADAAGELKAVPEPEKVFAATVREPEPTRLLERGDVNKPGAVVTPAGLSALRGLSPEFGLAADAPDRDRRVELAEWIASPDNPLFARVMVNRVWHYHFGAGLVANPNDFGFNGGRPSHPELLDWLAAEFIRGGWSVKKVHKLILMSEAYRQASAFNPAAAEKDADNRLLWRYSPRRLEAEAVRDAMLAASGTLNTNMYGPSFRPFEIVKNPGSYHIYKPADSGDPEQQRRTLYRMNVNSGGNPMLDALDCPVPSIKTPRRTVTDTPLQALSLMNNAFVERQAKAFAARLEREAPDAESRVRQAFLLALGRAPRAEELAESLALVNRHGLETLCWGLFNATEFLYVR